MELLDPEENCHGISIRDYLVVTAISDPHRARRACMEQMTRGFSPGQNQQGDLFADNLFDLGHVRQLPGAGHSRLAPQHRQGLQRPGCWSKLLARISK